jgi:hypothetical protein
MLEFERETMRCGCLAKLKIRHIEEADNEEIDVAFYPAPNSRVGDELRATDIRLEDLNKLYEKLLKLLEIIRLNGADLTARNIQTELELTALARQAGCH